MVDNTPSKSGTILASNALAWQDRVEFCERHFPSFRHYRSLNDNHPGMRVEMFTVLTQHIYGRSISEVLDIGIQIERAE